MLGVQRTHASHVSLVPFSISNKVVNCQFLVLHTSTRARRDGHQAGIYAERTGCDIMLVTSRTARDAVGARVIDGG